jgi:hypothetical protein
MNYLLNVWKIPIFLVYFAACLAVVLTFSSYLTRLSFKLKINFLKILAFLVLFGGILLCFFLHYAINAQLNDGEINQLYIINDDRPRLAVWFNRTDGLELADYYSHRLKTFDLEKGTLVGRLDLGKWENINDYELFGPFDGKAWGYSSKSGVRLIDLFQAKVLFNQEEIIKRNPELVRPLKAYAFDPLTRRLHVVTAKGKYYGIYPDLNVEPIRVDTPIFYPETPEKKSNTINLKNILIKKDQTVLATLTRDDEVLVFTTESGYRLFALRVEPNTGKILGKIKYF